MAHATADLEDELNGMDWDMNDIASAAAQQALAGAATGGSKLPSAVSGPSGPPSHPKITVTLKRSSETVTPTPAASLARTTVPAIAPSDQHYLEELDGMDVLSDVNIPVIAPTRLGPSSSGPGARGGTVYQGVALSTPQPSQGGEEDIPTGVPVCYPVVPLPVAPAHNPPPSNHAYPSLPSPAPSTHIPLPSQHSYPSLPLPSTHILPSSQRVYPSLPSAPAQVPLPSQHTYPSLPSVPAHNPLQSSSSARPLHAAVATGSYASHASYPSLSPLPPLPASTHGPVPAEDIPTATLYQPLQPAPSSSPRTSASRALLAAADDIPFAAPVPTRGGPTTATVTPAVTSTVGTHAAAGSAPSAAAKGSSVTATSAAPAPGTAAGKGKGKQAAVVPAAMDWLVSDGPSAGPSAAPADTDGDSTESEYGSDAEDDGQAGGGTAGEGGPDAPAAPRPDVRKLVHDAQVLQVEEAKYEHRVLADTAQGLKQFDNMLRDINAIVAGTTERQKQRAVEREQRVALRAAERAARKAALRRGGGGGGDEIGEGKEGRREE